GHRGRLASPVSLAEYLMAAPAAMIRASASRNQRNRTHAMMLTPGREITRNIDGFPRRPGLGVNVTDLSTRLGLRDRAEWVTKGDSLYPVQIWLAVGVQQRHQLL